MPQFTLSRVQMAVSDSIVQPQTLAVPPPPQEFGAAQLPQSTVRAMPQRSVAVAGPHCFPTRAQNAVSVSAAHAQTFGVPPPAQTAGAVHEPQSTLRLEPHLSTVVSVPQFLVSLVHSAASLSEQPHTLGTPRPPHVSTPEQTPQSSWPEQPSDIEPQFFCCAAHVVGAQPLASPTMGTRSSGALTALLLMTRRAAREPRALGANATSTCNDSPPPSSRDTTGVAENASSP